MSEIKLHHSVRVTAMDSADKPNRYHHGVPAEDLDGHIDTIRTIYPAHALFIDGKCVLQGILSPERIQELEAELKSLNWHPDIPTYPYH